MREMSSLFFCTSGRKCDRRQRAGAKRLPTDRDRYNVNVLVDRDTPVKPEMTMLALTHSR